MDNVLVKKNNSAKFAFFYILSLVALVFMTVGAGMIIFQIINKGIIDIISDYSVQYSDEQMKFAMAAIIISTPIYYFTTRQIHKNLFSGELDKESGVRKWLTYLILLVAFIVMISWLITTISKFLGGELTTKVILKAITVLVISGAVFAFYFYDIKREEILGKKDKIVKIYFLASLALILAIFVAAWFFVESPTVTRNKKIDQVTINNFYQIDSSLNTYYYDNKKLPTDLDTLRQSFPYLTDNFVSNAVNKEKYSYRVIGEKEYELCTIFQTSNKNELANGVSYPYPDKSWVHDAGYQCLTQKIREDNINGEKTVPIDGPSY